MKNSVIFVFVLISTIILGEKPVSIFRQDYDNAGKKFAYLSESNCVELSNETIDLGIISKADFKNFTFSIKNISNTPVVIERIDMDNLTEFTGSYHNHYSNQSIPSQLFLPIDGTLYPRDKSGNVAQTITIRFKSSNCETAKITLYATIFDNINAAISRGNASEIQRLILYNTFAISELSKGQIIAILKIVPDNSKLQARLISLIQNSNSIVELQSLSLINPEIINIRNQRLIELGQSIDNILQIVKSAPNLKQKFKDKLFDLAKNLRSCEEIIDDIPEWKSNYEPKISNYVTNSSELDRFFKYFPTSLYRSLLIQKIANNPTSFEDIIYIVTIEPTQKLRLENKAFQLLPKYAASSQCREFISLYPNSTYKGMVEAQYQAALMDERVTKTMDERLRQQQQTQPKDDRCNSCGGRGVCLECNGRGTKVCDYHDTNRDGHCTHCNDRGYLVCSKCDGKGSCTICKGKGRRN